MTAAMCSVSGWVKNPDGTVFGAPGVLGEAGCLAGVVEHLVDADAVEVGDESTLGERHGELVVEVLDGEDER